MVSPFLIFSTRKSRLLTSSSSEDRVEKISSISVITLLHDGNGKIFQKSPHILVKLAAVRISFLKKEKLWFQRTRRFLLSFETGLLGCFISRSLTVNLTETGLLGYFIPSQSLSVSFAGPGVILSWVLNWLDSIFLSFDVTRHIDVSEFWTDSTASSWVLMWLYTIFEFWCDSTHWRFWVLNWLYSIFLSFDVTLHNFWVLMWLFQHLVLTATSWQRLLEFWTDSTASSWVLMWLYTIFEFWCDSTHWRFWVLNWLDSFEFWCDSTQFLSFDDSS